MDLENTSNQSDFFDSSTPTTSDPSSPPDEPLAIPHETQHDTSDADSICHECGQVDWDRLSNRGKSWKQIHSARTIRSIGTNHKQLATSSCKICRILWVAKPQSLDDSGFIVGSRPLLHFGAYALPDCWNPKLNITALHVCPRGDITRYDTDNYACLAAVRRDSEDLSSRMIDPRSIDYDWLKRLARSCEESHKCNSMSLQPVSGLKVIEISSRTVIAAPAGCRYVALSYVWGKQPDDNLESHLQWPPPLIDDAISVTIAMGYEYLWIDRYVSVYKMANTNALIQI